MVRCGEGVGKVSEQSEQVWQPPSKREREILALMIIAKMNLKGSGQCYPSDVAAGTAHLHILRV